jgi:hypothetical protein
MRSILTLLAALFVAACGLTTSRSKLVLLLIDISETKPVADTVLYADAALRMIRTLKPGDRIVIIAVGSGTRSTLRAAADHVLPATGVTLNDAEARDSIIRLADETALRLVADRSAKATDILDAVTFAGEVGEGDMRPQQILLILTDALHEAGDYNFRRDPVDRRLTDRIIAQRKAVGSFPALDSTTQITLVGASGDPATYNSVRDFWVSYFRAAGAIVTAYGRTPLEVGQ